MRLSNSEKLGEECAMEELEIKEKIEEAQKGDEGLCLPKTSSAGFAVEKKIGS